jgi:hypothetical protein
MTPLNPLNTELTEDQLFFMETLKRKIKLFSKEELAQFVIDLQTQCFAYKNTINLLKQGDN